MFYAVVKQVIPLTVKVTLLLASLGLAVKDNVEAQNPVDFQYRQYGHPLYVSNSTTVLPPSTRASLSTFTVIPIRSSTNTASPAQQSIMAVTLGHRDNDVTVSSRSEPTTIPTKSFSVTTIAAGSQSTSTPFSSSSPPETTSQTSPASTPTTTTITKTSTLAEVSVSSAGSPLPSPPISDVKKCGIAGSGSNQVFFLTKEKLQIAFAIPKVGKPFVASLAKENRLINQYLERHQPSNTSSRRKRDNPSNSLPKRGGTHVAPTIVGGFLAEPFQLCWQVRLDITLDDGSSSSCGGSIIGPRTILTAAHCVFAEDSRVIKADQGRVTVGALNADAVLVNGADTTGCAETFRLSKIVAHPDYEASLSDNDIAILTLQRPIDFQNKACACLLCLEDRTPKRGDVCVVSGTGVQFTDDASSSLPLKWVRVAILQQSLTSGQCVFIENDDGQTTNLNLFVCAGNVVGEDSCQGDSGGPLACLDDSSAFYSAGVVSFGDGCGKGIGGQYTKTQAYLDWIRANALPEDSLSV